MKDAYYRNLSHLGHLLDDLEKARVANSNRIGAVEEEFGTIMASPALLEVHEQLVALEKKTIRLLEKDYKASAFYEWTKGIRGAGEKLMARLLTEIGDPSYATPGHWVTKDGERVLLFEEPRPRHLGELWQYCGHGDPNLKYELRSSKNLLQAELLRLGDPVAKKTVHLIAASLIRSTDDYYYAAIYRGRREKTRGRVHAHECPPCGPRGKPAQPGSPWSLKHQDADARRIVGKEFLRDLWIEAWRLRTEQTGELPPLQYQPVVA